MVILYYKIFCEIKRRGNFGSVGRSLKRVPCKHHQQQNQQNHQHQQQGQYERHTPMTRIECKLQSGSCNSSYIRTSVTNEDVTNKTNTTTNTNTYANSGSYYNNNVNNMQQQANDVDKKLNESGNEKKNCRHVNSSGHEYYYGLLTKLFNLSNLKPTLIGASGSRANGISCGGGNGNKKQLVTTTVANTAATVLSSNITTKQCNNMDNIIQQYPPKPIQENEEYDSVAMKNKTSMLRELRREQLR